MSKQSMVAHGRLACTAARSNFMALTPQKNGSPPIVLVVDDNPTLRELLDILLFFHGAKVIPAKSGIECLAITRSQRVDLVILDLMMPGMDGIQVSTELKRTTPSLPIILLT